jgi:2-aminoethylphosphonate-pyruvate transaminase
LEDSKGGFRFTSPVHCIRALSVAIRELKLQGGVKERYKRYSEMQLRLVEGMKEMRFRELDLKGYQGPIITTFHTPKCPNFNFNKFYERLKDQGCVIYPGKLSVTDSFRIGTIGSINIEDIEYLLQCIKNSIFWNNNI